MELYKKKLSYFSSLDSLASCAFGVNAGSFHDPTSVFVSYAARIFQNTKWDMFALFIRFLPGIRYILTWLKIDLNKPCQTRFFRDIVRQAIRERRRTGQRINDLLDLMIDCINKDMICEKKNDSPENQEDQYEQDMKLKLDSNDKHVKLDEEIVVATAMVFLVAGYDTTGMTLSFMAYNLAKQPAIQQKLQQEIDKAFEDAGGCLPDYSVIQVSSQMICCMWRAKVQQVNILM